MQLITLLRITGIITMLNAVYHLSFFLMPDREPTLLAIPKDTRYAFIIYHYIMVAFMCGSAYITTFQTKQLISNPIGKSLAVIFASHIFNTYNN